MSAASPGRCRRPTYLELIDQAGFADVRIAEAKPIALPDEVLAQHMGGEEIDAFRASGVELRSVTVLATKPEQAAPQ